MTENYLAPVLNRFSNKEELNLDLEEVIEFEKIKTNNALASQFPEWDLKPPSNVVRRKSTKML